MTETSVKLFRKLPDAMADLSDGLQAVQPDEPLFKRPTLLCLGGLFINQQSPSHEKDVNGFLKLGKAMLGMREHALPEDPMDVVGAAYPKSQFALTDHIHRYNEKLLKGEKPPLPSEAREFAAKYLYPLVQDEQGAARSLDDARKGLRNVQILAHSYGALFAQQLGDALADKMEALGFNASQVKEATSQVLVVSAGATTLPATGRASFTTFNVLSVADTQVDNVFRVREVMADLLAKAPAEAGLLVDGRNTPVHREAPRPMEGRFHAPREYPAQPFTVLPVSRVARTGALELKPDEASNHYMALLAQPLVVNGFGDVVARDVVNRYGTVKDVRGAPEGKKKLSPDDTGHQPSSYFHYNLQDDGQVHPGSMQMRTVISSVLAGGMNNAIKNAENPEKPFEPLPAMQTLVKLPVFMRYDVAPDVDFRNVADDGYNGNASRALVRGSRLGPRSR